MGTIISERGDLMKRMKKTLSAILSVMMIVPTLTVAMRSDTADAATFNEINDKSVFLIQEEYDTCTLCANAMLLRRAALIKGMSDWRSITESSIRSTVWMEGVGMYNSYTYRGISVSRGSFGSDVGSELRRLLADHPEGIVTYQFNNPHALLVTDYTDGVFYCADPSRDMGRIDNSLATRNVLNADVYWYVTSDLPKLTDALANKSTVSASSVKLGSSITIKGAATGGSGGYTYTYSSRLNGTSSWTSLGSGASYSFKPSKVGYYNIKVTVKDSSGKTVDKILNVAAIKTDLQSTTTASSTSVKLGSAVTLTGKATGGTESYTYKYTSKKNGSSNTVSLGSGASCKFTPSSAGTYVITATVTDTSGKTASNSITIKVTEDTLVNKSTFTSGLVNLGNNISVTGAASGGSLVYNYKYYYKAETSSSWIQFGAGSSASFKPTTNGVFELKSTVTDTSGHSAEKTSTVTILDGSVVNNSKISATKLSINDKSSVVTVTGAAKGGSGNYSYTFYFRKSGASKWNTVKADGNTASFRPYYAGKYEIKVSARDNRTGSSSDKILNLEITNELFKNQTTLSKQTCNAGDTVTITGAASGGSGKYTYSYSYRKPGKTSWISLGNGKSAILRATDAGVYEIRVNAIDSNGKTSQKTLRLCVNGAKLENLCSVSSTSIKTGSSVTVKGAAKGGTGQYTYRFFYRKSGSSSWNSLGSGTSASLKLSAAGTYQVMAVVYDTSGIHLQKTLNVTAS